MTYLDTECLAPLISQESINEKVQEYARIIEREYAGKDLLIVMIMKGAFCFVADLVRELKIPACIDFLTCSSYGMRGTVPGELKVHGIERLDVKGKHVLLIDDIFDTGRTLSEVYSRIKLLEPEAVGSMVLLGRNTEREVVYHPDHVLFQVEEDAFVVGYGLDYKEQYRGLPGICVLHHHE